MPHLFCKKGRLLLAKSSSALLLLACTTTPTYALKLVYESQLSTESSKIDLIGDYQGGQTGATIATGDFNHDGVQDLAIASPFASIGEDQWNGSVKIIFGNKDRTKPHSSLEYYGENPADQLGTAMVSGDFNNDGYDDLAIGSYNAKSGMERPGKVYIIYGSTSMSSQVPSQSTIHPLVSGSTQRIDELTGVDNKDQFGLSLFAIDLNEDGKKDLLVGAPFASGQEFFHSGAVYLYNGTDRGLSKNPNFTFFAQSDGEKFGSAISGGHINSLQKNDIVVGAYTANVNGNQQAGKVYVLRYNSHASYAKTSQMIISGSTEKGWFGFALAVGDVNGDHYDDIGISTFPYTGNRQGAKVSIFYGARRSNKKFADIIVDSPVGESFLGATIKLEDINEDGKADIIMGAPVISLTKSSEEGSVYIINSGQDPYKDHYSIRDHDYDSVIYGENPDDWFGSTLDALDFDNDGHMDLAIASRYAAGTESVNDGKVTVLWGNGKPIGKPRSFPDRDDPKVSRGEVVNIIMDRLKINSNKKDSLKSCYDHKEFCLFNFMAISSYNKLQLEPQLILYPDVQPESIYYASINEATALGLVSGYAGETDSPFHPELPVSRIEALKIVLGAADLVEPKYQFELVASLGSYKNLLNQKSDFKDINSKIPGMWWYPRYANFAYDHNIIDSGDFFRPNDNITVQELDSMITKTIDYLNSGDKQDAKTKS